MDILKPSPVSGPDVSVAPMKPAVKSRTGHRRLRYWLDQAGGVVVWVGGIATIVSILGIFLYLLWEVFPLFRSASGAQEAELSVSHAAPLFPGTTLIGMDEYREVVFVLDGNRLKFLRMPQGTPVPDVGGTLNIPGTVQSSVLVGQKGNLLSVGTKEGLVLPIEVQIRPVFEDSIRTMVPSVTLRQSVRIIPEGKILLVHAHTQKDETQTIAALATDGTLWLTWVEEPGEFSFSDELKIHQRQLMVPPQMTITRLVLDRFGKRLVAGTQRGELVEWNLQDEAASGTRHVLVTTAGDPVTALKYLLGERTLIVGTESGQVMTWAPQDFPQAGGGGIPFRKIVTFQSHRNSVEAISWSQRDKGFLTADSQGGVILHHATTGQTVLEFPPGGQATAALRFSPKADGGVWLGRDGQLRTFSIDNPHPEATFRSLFFPVTYEGYDQPEYIWQSSSGSDEFEPKLGLMPLIFGTFKGTIYAMILAIPLAVMGAVYTAMFMHPHLRAIIKPTIEIMAALPSVVLGFLAGLWFAPLLQDIFPAVVVIMGLLPLVIGLVCLLWQALPKSVRHLDRYGVDLAVLIMTIVLTVGGCLLVNSSLESLLFGGNYKQWLSTNLGLVYDQRNAIVISFAMGFAVIPIIFSISEDSIANVPRHLVAGSLALGATRWQTLTRLVIISASPGIFSALMIGFGRAIGETMIVLMATGNTPIVDWSMFNGFRTLSANIAVEMPEAPHGGTLYRVLFLSGLILFAFTFSINTMAELMRQRLRKKYSQY
jgi:phosphate transport system permease protein